MAVCVLLYNVNLPVAVLFGGVFGVTPVRPQMSQFVVEKRQKTNVNSSHSVLSLEYNLVLWDDLNQKEEHGSSMGRIWDLSA